MGMPVEADSWAVPAVPGGLAAEQLALQALEQERRVAMKAASHLYADAHDAANVLAAVRLLGGTAQLWLAGSGCGSDWVNWCLGCVMGTVFCCRCCCPAPAEARLCEWLSWTPLP